MTYDELPYEFRNWCESKSIAEDRSVSYWGQAKEYREYLESVLLRKMAHAFSQDDIYVVTTVDDLLVPVRGERVNLT